MVDLVVKDNALIQASYTLDLAEQRLILLAIVEARESQKGITSDSLLNIHASSYAKQFNINNETAYTVMKEASKGLFDRYITYHDKNPKNGKDRSFHCRWVDKIGYEEGSVYIRFTSDVVPLITALESQFTSYELAKVANLTSGYAIRLYELLIQWKTVGKTEEFTIDELRGKLGVEANQYKTLGNLKSRVIDAAVKQINDYTDLNVKYTQSKKGRTIVGLTFTFKTKKSVKPKEALDALNYEQTYYKLTPSQLTTYSSKLSRLPELGGMAKIGATVDEFAAQIASELTDPAKQMKYHKYLTKLGFKVA